MVRLVEVEDQIKLTHIPEIPIKDLNEVMNGLQNDQLVVIIIHARQEIQGSIPTQFNTPVINRCLSRLHAYCKLDISSAIQGTVRNQRRHNDNP
mmetsp:Transcript_44830/g.102940  ORF Transcript_44830/g.102940 Transcript_44830/m.102940 type:complete len:94 (+) Transcript_44830:449-730(+)